MSRKQINQISAETESAILRKSAYSLPNRPSEAGMKAEDVKKAFYKSMVDTENSLLSEMKRVITEANEADSEIEKQIENLNKTTEDNQTENAKSFDKLNAQVNNLSNPNILINGDFRVNQRNFTSTTNIGFTVDRWKNTRTNTSVTLNDDGTITLSSTPTQNNNTLLTQKLEEKDYKNLLGGAITVSAMVSLDEGQTYNVYSITAVLPQTLPTTSINNEIYFTDDTGVRHGSVRQYWTGTQFVVDVLGYDGYNVRVKWVKLEKGDIATPYNPRPYAEEFAMCQRYYQVVNVEGIAFTTFGQVTVDDTQYHGANTLVSLPATLRTKPTVTITKMPYLRNYQGQNNIAAGYTEIIKFGDNIISLQFYNSSIPSGVIYYVHNGMAILDAEIY